MKYLTSVLNFPSIYKINDGHEFLIWQKKAKVQLKILLKQY